MLEVNLEENENDNRLFPDDFFFLKNDFIELQFPKIDFNTTISLILLFDQSKQILIDKLNNKLLDTNLNEFVISHFKESYPAIFSDIKGIQINAFYIKENNEYVQRNFNDVQDLKEINTYIYVEIISNEVWAQSEITFQTSIFLMKINSEIKLDRFNKLEHLKYDMLKTAITQWNYAMNKEDFEETSETQINIEEYLNFHYLIDDFSFSIIAKNEPGFNWDKEILNRFNIKIVININCIILEEIILRNIQKKIKKITSSKENIIWSIFYQLKSINELINEEKLQKEFYTFKLNIKRLAYIMGKETSFYLYFSSNVIKIINNTSSSISSSLFESEREKEKENNSILIIRRKVNLIKKNKNIIKNIITDNNNSHRKSNSFVITPETKKSFKIISLEKNKTFIESPIEEPFILIPNDRDKENFPDKKDKENFPPMNKKKERKVSLNNVNTAAKRIYKNYEREGSEENNDDILTIEYNRKSCCQKFKEIIKEARMPSVSVSLTKEIERMINKKIINKIKNIQNLFKMKKKILEKYNLLSIRNLTYDLKLKSNDKMKDEQKNKNKKSIFFHIELLVTSTILILILTFVFLCIIYFIERN